MSNVAYIELDIPKYKLKPEMLQLLPNIEYTNTDTKRLCGQEVSKRKFKKKFEIEFSKNILERIFRKGFFFRFNLVKFLIGNVGRILLKPFFRLISLRPLTGPIELLSDYHTLVET